MIETAHKREVVNAQARKTCLVVGGVLALIAAWQLYRGRMTAVAVLGGVALALVLVGLLVPALARPFHVVWMKLAHLLGYVNSRVLLSLLFYTAFTLYGLFSRLFGRDPLNRRRAARSSYWIPRKRTRQTKEGFERSF